MIFNAALSLQSTGLSIVGGERGYDYPHKVSGSSLDDAGNPFVCRIVAIDRLSLTTLGRTTSSAEDGSWTIKGMPATEERSICIQGFDDSGEYNAEPADYITAYGGSAEESEG